MSERPLEPRMKLAVKQTTRSVRAVVDELVSVVDLDALEDGPAPEKLALNDIGVVRLRLAEPLCVDPYARKPRDRRVHLAGRGDERDRRRRHGSFRVMTWQFTLTGLLLGTVVGLTGMGGGSLMTPILVIVFGFKPTYAVGTDIFHGAIFKSFGAIRHRQLGTVHMRLALWMFIGSGPMSLLGVAASNWITHTTRTRRRSRATSSAARSSPAGSASSRSRSSSAASSRATRRSCSRTATS